MKLKISDEREKSDKLKNHIPFTWSPSGHMSPESLFFYLILESIHLEKLTTLNRAHFQNETRVLTESKTKPWCSTA